MPFSVKANIDQQVAVPIESAREAFAKAVEWHVVEKLIDISISDGIRSWSIDEFSLLIANLEQN